jgi:hypothetical protein
MTTDSISLELDGNVFIITKEADGSVSREPINQLTVLRIVKDFVERALVEKLDELESEETPEKAPNKFENKIQALFKDKIDYYRECQDGHPVPWVEFSLELNLDTRKVLPKLKSITGASEINVHKSKNHTYFELTGVNFDEKE